MIHLDLAAKSELGRLAGPPAHAARAAREPALLVVAGDGSRTGRWSADGLAEQLVAELRRGLDVHRSAEETGARLLAALHRLAGGRTAAAAAGELDLAVLVFSQHHAILCTIGRAQCHRLRGAHLERLPPSDDETLVATLVGEEGSWAAEELGMATSSAPLHSGDAYLLSATDPWVSLAPADLQRALSGARSAAGACDAVIGAAWGLGGISVAVARLAPAELSREDPFRITTEPSTRESGSAEARPAEGGTEREA